MTLLDRFVIHLRRLGENRMRRFRSVPFNRFEALGVVRILRIGDELVLDDRARLTDSYQAVFLPSHKALGVPANDALQPDSQINLCLKAPG